MAPSVTVIIPTYNHAHFLPHAVHSVLQQTFQDFEVVIVDDGSIDNTYEVVQKFEDARLKYIFQENRGLASARNTGLRVANGEFVAFLDADDLFLPRKLEVQVDWLQNHRNHGLVAGGWYDIDEQGKIIGMYQPWINPPKLGVRNWLSGCLVNPVSILMTRKWVERVGGFDEKLRQVEDWDMWLRLAYAGCKMGWVNEIICSYRFSPGQMTRNAAIQKQASIQMLDKFFNQIDLPSDLIVLKPDVYSNLYILSAGREYGAGQDDDARESLTKAEKSNPKLQKGWGQDQLELFLFWVNSPACHKDPIEYINHVFKSLPAEVPGLRSKKRWIYGEIGMRTFFTSYKLGEWRNVQLAATIVALHEPYRLWNRGVWSILWQTITKKHKSH